jgi:hypothetical protein
MAIDEYLKALEAYRGFHPDGWVAIYRIIPTWLGLVLGLVGGFLLPFGGGRPFRFVAAPLGGVVGFFLTPAVLNALGIPLDAGVAAPIGAMSLFVIGAIFPPGVVFFAAGLPAGLIAGKLVGAADFLLGFIPAFLLTGTLGSVLHRHVGSIASAAVGGWLLVIGLLAALHRSAMVEGAATHAWAMLAAAGMFALAGAVYQIAVKPSPEEDNLRRIERERVKKKLAEERALEERWAKYSDKR